MLTNKGVAFVSFQLIRLLEMCERQTDNHIGLDPVAKKYRISLVCRFWNMSPNKLAIVCLISKIILSPEYVMTILHYKSNMEQKSLNFRTAENL